MAYETLMETLKSESYAKEADIERVRKELAALLKEMTARTEEGREKGKELVALLLGDALIKAGGGMIAGLVLSKAVATLAEKGYSEEEIEYALIHVWERIDASKLAEKSLPELKGGRGDAVRLLNIAKESSTAEEFRERAMEFGQKLLAENLEGMADALLKEVLSQSERLITEKRIKERYGLSTEQFEKVLKVMDEYGLSFEDGVFKADAVNFQYEMNPDFGDAPFDEDFRKFLEESIDQYYEIREELEKAGIKEPEVEIVGANGVLNGENIADFEEAAEYMAAVQRLAEEGREDELREKLEERYSEGEVEDMMRWLGFESDGPGL